MAKPTYQGILGKRLATKPYDNVDELIALAKYYNDMFGLPENLVPAAMMKESDFNHKAKSKSGPMGLMQLAGGTRFDTGVSNPYDPEESLMGGAAYYRSMMDNYPKLNIDTMRKLSAMYTEGPGAASRMVTGKVPYNNQANNHYLKIKDALRKINAADDTIADYRELTEEPIRGNPMEIDIPIDFDNYSEGSLDEILKNVGYGKPTGMTLQKYMELPAKARKILEKFKKLYPEPVPSVVELPEEFDPFQDILNSVNNVDTVPIRW